MNILAKHNPHVIMTYMCQHCIASGNMVTAQIMQRWLQCSKPTALAILEEYRTRGYIERFTHHWRANSVQYNYRPIKPVFDSYRRGEYRDSYNQYMRGLK